jgi:hypothetical protein
MRRLTIALVLLAALVVPAARTDAQEARKSLQQIVEMLVSDDVAVRREARELLERYLDALAPEQRKDEIGKLCTRLWDGEYRERLGLAVAMSQLKQPWESSRQEEHVSKLYATMQDTKDDTLRRYLDDALANAKGLYFDAINDYNSIDENDPDGELGRVREVTAKFRRMAGFSESVYAGNAVFYLGQYLARMATIFGRRDPGLIADSTDAFDDYIDRAKEGAYRRPAFYYDAFFYQALNQVISGKPARAIELLGKIPDGPDERIYVYQFFWSKDPDTVVDRTIDGGRLVKETIRYIGEARDDAIDRQLELVKAVGGLKSK